MRIVNMWNTGDETCVFLKGQSGSVFMSKLTGDLKNNAEELVCNCLGVCDVNDYALYEEIVSMLIDTDMLKHLTREVSIDSSDLGEVHRLVNKLCKLIIALSGRVIFDQGNGEMFKVGPADNFTLWNMGMRRISTMIKHLDTFGLEDNRWDMLP